MTRNEKVQITGINYTSAHALPTLPLPRQFVDKVPHVMLWERNVRIHQCVMNDEWRKQREWQGQGMESRAI